MSRALLVLSVIASLLLSGCGDTRTTAPSLTRPSVGERFRTIRYPGMGLSVAVPGGWALARSRPPLLLTAASGNAIVALWRYRRPGPAPAGTALIEARRLLIAAVKARQPGLRLLRSRMISIAHRPAIVLETIESIRGLLRRVRSVHVFATGQEIVLEEYAPLSVFAYVSRHVFTRVRRSLKLPAS